MPKVKISDAYLFFDVYGSQLSITETGVKEKPTLIVLHGGHGIADHTLYVKFWSQFSGIAQVIFLDQRGCGRSDPCDSSGWNLAHWGQDVYDFCQALNIKKPIIAGVSMGGHVMCEYVNRYPEHPGALIFCNTEAKLDLEAMVEKFDELGGKEVAEICRQNYLSPTPESVDAYQDHCIPYYAKNAYTRAEVKRCLQHPEIFEHYCQHEMMRFDYLDTLSKIACPTLLMVGEQSPGHPPKCAQLMKDKIKPGLVTYHEFKGAGAPVYNDSPEEAYQVVHKFIQSIIASEG
ncbi:MAG: hypothetical protein COV52_05075 [Gammaproteobacteria bacterium CG11_big_fil_rev_8_21_14_0_20_46_22]|nr:MAG: hypothetical protein COW05_10180 [Gammaproteobacteria bacterium CG12_big_fil_rev_8_21_14_0_65_46_12]PIR11169.1 MAG: hypothetical protein COV52_05075 [Gammaproteobacteria bacterium CG11_big_fil_rev_8_21_14_0_20_46_22]